MQSLTKEERKEAVETLELWHRIRRAREHHVLARRESAHLPFDGNPAVVALRQRRVVDATLWVDALDAAILEFGPMGPARVLDAAQEQVERGQVWKAYSRLLPACERIRDEGVSFADLSEDEQLQAISLAIGRADAEQTAAQAADTIERARKKAAAAFVSEAFRKAMGEHGPSRACAQAIASLIGSSEPQVRKFVSRRR